MIHYVGTLCLSIRYAGTLNGNALQERYEALTSMHQVS